MHPLPWSLAYPVASIPDDIRHHEVSEYRGQAVRCYRWDLFIAEFEVHPRSRRWELRGASAVAEVVIATGEIIHGGVQGHWNRLIDANEWRRLGLMGFRAADPDQSALLVGTLRREIADLISGMGCDNLACGHGQCDRARVVALQVAGLLAPPPDAETSVAPRSTQG